MWWRKLTQDRLLSCSGQRPSSHAESAVSSACAGGIALFPACIRADSRLVPQHMLLMCLSADLADLAELD